MYIAVEGVIGVGKTSLARLLQSPFRSNILLEIFEENPFLPKFYEDRERYAFQTQMFFLLSRYDQQRRGAPKLMMDNKKILISDYTFYKDALFAQITLSGDELEMYSLLHAVLAEKIPSPDLIVYLRATTDTLMHRIALRDRPYERSMDRQYVDLVNTTYDNYFLKQENERKVLIIDSNDLDFVHNADDLRWIENRIRQRLQLPPFQPELPITGIDRNS
ncbi:MAG: deoxynucleoside kinase [Anaerolineaceae bacterium]|nr:deoxynucleoside kinase [Anaerolineaceae bacterium]